MAKTPPYHGGDIRIESGELKLEISPDPNFDSESPDQKPGQPAAEQYNNAFAIGMKGFSPNRGEVIAVEFRMKVDEGYQGTTGLWLEAQDTFDEVGLMVEGGFPGAFGVSYVSPDSWAPVAGFKFEYAKGFTPLCIGSIDADPFEKNLFRIEWAKGPFWDIFTLDVNGKRQGGCFIPFIGFEKSEVQVWADNYKIGEWATFLYLNPEGVQGTNFDFVSVVRIRK